jgi:hypothetical protein
VAGHRVQFISQGAQARREALLLLAGLAGELCASLLQEVFGLCTGFGGHVLRLVLRDRGYLLAGVCGAVPDGGSLLLRDADRALIPCRRRASRICLGQGAGRCGGIVLCHVSPLLSYSAGTASARGASASARCAAIALRRAPLGEHDGAIIILATARRDQRRSAWQSQRPRPRQQEPVISPLPLPGLSRGHPNWRAMP